MRFRLPSSVLLVLPLVLGCAAAGDSTTDGTSGPPAGSSEEASTNAPATPPPITPPPTTDPGSTSTDPSTTSGEGSSEATGAQTGSTTTLGDGEFVRLETTLGDIVIELDPVAAPITVANFYAYVDAGFYDGTDGMGETVFHRVATGFVVQGGGELATGVLKPPMAPITNESGNGLTNVRMSVAMARTDNPDSATSQFFFNLVDNFFLDEPPGYAVFGQVVLGDDVIDAMADVALNGEEPVDPIVITGATRE